MNGAKRSLATYHYAWTLDFRLRVITLKGVSGIIGTNGREPALNKGLANGTL